MQSNSYRFIRNIGWLMGGKIVNMILQFLVSLATARYLGPSNFGTINYVAAFVSFFSSIASLGLAVIVIREVAIEEHDSNETIWTSIGMRLGIALLSSISIVALMYIMNRNDPYIVQIAALESLAIIFSAFDTMNYYFQAKLLSKWSSISGVLAYIGMSLYRIYLLAKGADIIWFALATSMDMIFLAFFLMFFYIKIEGFRPNFNWARGKYLLKHSYHYLIAGLITIVYAQIDRIMIGNMLDKSAVGFYSAALAIAALWSMVPSTLIQSISPVLYNAASQDRNLYMRRLRQSYAIIFWLNVLYSVFICFSAHWVIIILYGKDYLGAKNALRIVVWYYGISTMSTLNQVYLANDGKNKYVNRFCIAGLITDVVLNLIFIPRWGINGAAGATLITHLVIQIVIPYVYKDTREITISIVKGALLQDVLNDEERKSVIGHIKKILKMC